MEMNGSCDITFRNEAQQIFPSLEKVIMKIVHESVALTVSVMLICCAFGWFTITQHIRVHALAPSYQDQGTGSDSPVSLLQWEPQPLSSEI